jgi:hypothetical protein
VSRGFRFSTASSSSTTSPSSWGAPDFGRQGGTAAQPMPVVSFAGLHGAPHTPPVYPHNPQQHYGPRQRAGAAVSASPTGTVDSATPFLSSSAAQCWSPDKRQQEASRPQTLPPAAALPQGRVAAYPSSSYDSATEYASAAREVNQALAEHYAQQAADIHQPVQREPQKQGDTATQDTPARQTDTSSAIRAASMAEDARQWSPTVPPPLPLQPKESGHESPARTT